MGRRRARLVAAPSGRLAAGPGRRRPAVRRLGRRSPAGGGRPLAADRVPVRRRPRPRTGRRRGLTHLGRLDLQPARRADDAARAAQRLRQLGVRTTVRPTAYDGREPGGPHGPGARRRPPPGQRRHQRRDRRGALHLPRRPTAHHVSAVLAKLGVTSRREAGRAVAAWPVPTD